MAAATCQSCPHWSAPRALPERVKPEVAATYHLDRGTCHRFPEVISKLPDEGCGEHPEKLRQRDDELASRFAWAIEAAQQKRAAPKRGR